MSVHLTPWRVQKLQLQCSSTEISLFDQRSNIAAVAFARVNA